MGHQRHRGDHEVSAQAPHHSDRVDQLYLDQTSEGAVIVDSRPFTILGDLRIVERRAGGAVNASLGYFKFDDHILRNLQLNFTKPVRIDEFFRLKSEIAQLVYTHVDLVLFDKSRYERRTRNLFNDLGLRNPEYEHMFERKRALERALRELEGMRLSKGVLKSATLAKTTDGKDYKAVFTRDIGATARRRNRRCARPTSGKAGRGQQLRRTEGPGRRSGGTDRSPLPQDRARRGQPRPAEQGGRPGAEPDHPARSRRRHVHRGVRGCPAGETNFSMQHFGAVLSYASRAMAERDRSRRGRDTAAVGPVKPASSAVARAELHSRGKRLLRILSPEQYAARADALRAHLKQRPFLRAGQDRQQAFGRR